MSSLIKIDDVLECIEDAQDGSKKTYDILADVFNRVLALPSAEAVQGEWVAKEKCDADGCYWWIECSECGRKPLLDRWNHGENLSNYCPNCGAKMTKGGEEDE